MTTRGTIRRLAAAVSVALLATAFGPGAAADEPVSVAQDCVNQRAIRRTKVLNDRTILFVARNGQQYINQLPRQCPSLRRNSLVNYAVANSQFCAGSTFTVLWETGTNRYSPAFVCPLGMFLPVSADEVADIMALTDESSAGRQRRRSERDMVQTERVELPQPAAPATAPHPATPAAP
jgi:hypothetical protein